MNSNRITIVDIKNNFVSTTYNRGLRYFKLGSVLKVRHLSTTEDLTINKTTVLITSIVKSINSNSIYTQDITFMKNGPFDMKFNGDCTCPVGRNCKHVVSALLFYINDNTQSKNLAQIRALESIDNWINKVSVNRQQQYTNRALENNYKLEYRLAKNNSAQGLGYSIYSTKSKALKRGGFSKPASVSLEYLIRKRQNYLPKFITIQDEEIFALLSRVDSFYYGNNVNNNSQFQLQGELGYILLERMLDTGRLYLGSSEIPLQKGASKSVKIDWRKTEQEYKLDIIIDDNSSFVNIKPPVYLDFKDNKIGLALNFNLDEKDYSELIEQSPTIPENMIDLISDTLIKKLPSIPPLVSKNVIHKKINSKPKPHLVLDRNQVALTFDYDGNRVKYSAKNMTISKKENNEIITIFRNMEDEMDFRSKILDCGFINHKSDDIFYSSESLSISESVEQWRVFKDEVIPKLRNEGWTADISPNFNYTFEDIEEISVNINDSNSWFDIEMTVEINNEKVSLLPMVTEFLTQVDDIKNLDEKINLPFAKGKFIRVASETMKPIIRTIIELYDGKDNSKDGILTLKAFEAHTVAFLENNEKIIVQGSDRLLELSKKLRDFKGLKNLTPPKGLTTELRDYQKVGLNWLDFLREFGFGGILADDMGLGKTIQTLTFLQREKEQKRLTQPVLIVMPTSLLGNWRREIEKFTPDLKLLILHGDKRQTHFSSLTDYDIVLTTYGLIVRDFKKLLKTEFYYIILDEAQKIKNPKAKVSQHLGQLNSKYRLALTGTPMENHLGEVWSIFTFLMPGFLGQADKFNKIFRKPIEKENNEEVQKILKKRIEPFMLRRKKDEVVKELPKKTVIVQTVTFEKKQAQLYETIRITMEKRVRDVIAEKGLASSQITILDALLKLRQVCCDPSILKLDSSKNVTESAKLEALLSLIEELISEGRKILLFSQFTTMLGIIEQRIIKMKITYSKLTGSTRNRDAVIDKFKSGKADLFLISLKAGGVGLNLTEADTVIHYDPWWNPAVEEQATDRAYRIGQDKPVFVYKLIAEKTVEEKILELQDKKRALANIMIDNNSKEKFKLTQDDISSLFAPIL